MIDYAGSSLNSTCFMTWAVVDGMIGEIFEPLNTFTEACLWMFLEYLDEFGIKMDLTFIDSFDLIVSRDSIVRFTLYSENCSSVAGV